MFCCIQYFIDTLRDLCREWHVWLFVGSMIVPQPVTGSQRVAGLIWNQASAWYNSNICLWSAHPGDWLYWCLKTRGLSVHWCISDLFMECYSNQGILYLFLAVQQCLAVYNSTHLLILSFCLPSTSLIDSVMHAFNKELQIVINCCLRDWVIGWQRQYRRWSVTMPMKGDFVAGFRWYSIPYAGCVVTSVLENA